MISAKIQIKMEQEKFIERILNSTNGMTQVNPDEHLFSKIKARIEDEKPADNLTKWLIAASIVILISLNIGILSTSNSKQTNELSALVNVSDNQLY